MKKSNDIIFYSLLALCLFTNCLFIGYYYYQQNREVLLGQELEHQKKQNYELIVNQIESGIIPHVISDKKNLQDILSLCFLMVFVMFVINGCLNKSLNYPVLRI